MASPGPIVRCGRFQHSGRMSTIVDHGAAAIAYRVRLEREARGWSLADLAARSGVSRSMISKVERREASPTAAVLVRLAGAFDLTLAGLIARAEGDADRLVRLADQPVWRDPASGYRRRQVFERADHPVELVRVELPAGARVDLPAASYAHIRQVVWVLEGELLVEEGGVRRALAAGDCLGFGPPADTSFANEAAGDCTYLVALARS
jgi:transcriptional regulator with XRE-family HTH domain